MPLNWLSKTTYAVVETRRRITPDAVALIVPEEDELREVTYAALLEGVHRMAAHLWAADVRAGSHVALWAENSPAWIEAWLATSLIGAVTVAVNTRLTLREARELLARHDATHLLAGGRCAPAAADLLAEGGGPTYIGSLDGSVGLPDLRDGASAWSGAPIDGDRVGLMQFTSGSTGMPKGVQLREGAVAALGASCASRWFLTPADRVFGVFSLAHNAGSTYTTMAAFTAGAAVILPTGGWSAGRGVALANQAGATVLPSLDTIITDVLASSVRPDGLRLIVGGFDKTAAERIVRELKVEISNTYGLSESTANVAVGDLRDPLEVRIERAGRPHPGLAARVVDEAGDVLPAGTRGELQFTGWSRMAGYYGLPPEDQPFTPDGWVRTGDLGTIDELGYISFLGRLKDVIRSGGENVAAFEIEHFLETHPKVLQAAVVPVPHPRFGEVPFAFIRPRPNTSIAAAELSTYCEGELAVFKIPRHFELVQSFPLVGPNKVSKPALRARANELVAAESANPSKGVT